MIAKHEEGELLLACKKTKTKQLPNQKEDTHFTTICIATVRFNCASRKEKN